jgi:hypothetical protein
VYPALAYFNEVPKGGHFAAWEEPDLCATEPARDSDENATSRTHGVAQQLPQSCPQITVSAQIRYRESLIETLLRKTRMDVYKLYCTGSDGSKAGGTIGLGTWNRPLQVRAWELNSPVNSLINRAFLNVVVMGTIEV